MSDPTPGPAGDSPPSDRDLLAAHVAGDPEAFGTLVTRHRDRLWAVALRTTGDREVAADALQDALVSAFRRAGTFRGDAQVTTWLHRVVVNACLDRLRSARVRRTEPLPDEPQAADDLADRTRPVSDRSGDPETRAVDDERRRAVVAALAELPPEQRAAVVLVDMEGYSVAEAAQVLDCPVGTVKSRCSRARARLAAVLAPLLVDDDATPPGPGRPGNRPTSVDVGSAPGRAPPPAHPGGTPTTRPPSPQEP